VFRDVTRWRPSLRWVNGGTFLRTRGGAGNLGGLTSVTNILKVCGTIVVCLGLWACGGGADRLPVVTARGKVTLGGEPLAGATLVFAPQDGSKHVGSALSGANGEFEIQMNNQRGALPGRYKVIVTKFIYTEPRLQPGEHVETPGESRLLTPKKYSQLETTDLEVTVPPNGSDTLEINLL
jgi:hypothetical protein